MTDTLDITQLYIKNLEDTVSSLTKSKVINETNIAFLNALTEQKDKKIEELNKNGYEFNEIIGNIQTQHQAEIEKQHREKNEEVSDLWNKINCKQGEIDNLKNQVNFLMGEINKHEEFHKKDENTINNLIEEIEKYRHSVSLKPVIPEIKTLKGPEVKTKKGKNLSTKELMESF
jgi:chromosome segregation ATPase